MTKQIEIPARLILHWSTRLFQEQYGRLDSVQHDDLSQIQQAAQRLLDFVLTREYSLTASDLNSTMEANQLAELDHLLRSDLNTINGFAFVFIQQLNGPLTVHQIEQFLNIRRAVRISVQWLNKVLPRIRDTTNEFNLHFEYFALETLLQDIQEVVYKFAERKSVEISYWLEDNLPFAFADKFRTRQIIWQLLSNAVKLATVGSILVRVQTIYPRTQRCRLQLQLTMAGYEMASDEVALLNRGAVPRNYPIDSAFITSPQIAKLIGGRIWFANQINGSTTVSVELYTMSTQRRHTTFYNVPRWLQQTHPLRFE